MTDSITTRNQVFVKELVGYFKAANAYELFDESGDLRHHTDFRRVYAAVLEGWLGWPSAPALGGTYRPLRVLRG